MFEVIQEQQENVNRELYQTISGIANTEFSAEKLTDVIFKFYKMTEKMLILKLIDVGEVELLVRKLPWEIVEEHFQDNTDTIKKCLPSFWIGKAILEDIPFYMLRPADLYGDLSDDSISRRIKALHFLMKYQDEGLHCHTGHVKRPPFHNIFQKKIPICRVTEPFI